MEYAIKNNIFSPLWIIRLLADAYASISIVTATSSIPSAFWIIRLNYTQASSQLWMSTVIIVAYLERPTPSPCTNTRAPSKRFSTFPPGQDHSLPTCNKLPYFCINRFPQQSQQCRNPTNILHCYFIFICRLAKNKVSEGTTSILLNFQNSVVQKVNQMLDSP